MQRLPRLPKEVDDLGTTETSAASKLQEEDYEMDNNNNSGDEASRTNLDEPDSSHSSSTPIPISSQGSNKPLLSSKVESLGFSTTDGEGTLQSIVSPRVFLPVNTVEEPGSFVSSYSKKPAQEQEMPESFDWASSFMDSEPLFSHRQRNTGDTLDR